MLGEAGPPDRRLLLRAGSAAAGAAGGALSSCLQQRASSSMRGALPTLRRRLSAAATPRASHGDSRSCGCRRRASLPPGSSRASSTNSGGGAAQGAAASHFIRAMVERDTATGSPAVLRFPPEPNGQLHIGHAKAICLNFGLAQDLEHVTCNLRFDDTNPARAREEHMRAIQRDIRWLGYEWNGPVRFASNYFEQLHALATALVADGKAFVCSLPHAEALKQRGSATQPGTPSPYRGRSVEDNLALWREMRAGHHPDGSHVLRAKIEPPDVTAAMASPNLRMRDPVMYRIRHNPPHARVVSGALPGEGWCVYPTYDWAHCMSDAIEGVTHSLCTMEFVDHNEIYDWFVRHAPPILLVGEAEAGGDGQQRVSYPRQTEYGRLNLQHTVTSKRKLATLVEAGVVDGWDDPRMPTLAGLRRRGVPPAAIRLFCSRVGVTRVGGSVVEQSMLEGSVREILEGGSGGGRGGRRDPGGGSVPGGSSGSSRFINEQQQQKKEEEAVAGGGSSWVTPRAMAVLRPLPVTLTSLHEPLELLLPHHPDHVDSMGRRVVPLTR